MNKIILFGMSFFAANMAWAQQASTAAPSGSTETVNADSVPIEEYVPKVIIEGKWGTGPGEFGYDGFYPKDFSPKRASFTPDDFIYPQSIAIDSKSNVYILDTANNRIQKFNEAGRCQKELKVDSWSGYARRKDGEDGYVYSVRGINIVIDSKDTLYYYLKRVKDDKETGEVWEFKNDKRVRVINVPYAQGVLDEMNGSLWITAYPYAVNTDIGEDYNVIEGKKYLRKKINDERKQKENMNIRFSKNKVEIDSLNLASGEEHSFKPLPGEQFSSEAILKDTKILILSQHGNDEILNQYDFSGKLLNRLRTKTRPQNGIRDFSDNIYQLGSSETGVEVKKYHRQLVRE